MLRQPHLLIAGSTGSGKSVLINSILHTALHQAPNRVKFILIDPKRVELVDYKPLPHTLMYASEPPEILSALLCAEEIMEQRYTQMQRNRAKKWDGADIYIIVDEFADLMTTAKHQTLPPLLRLAQLGRAAGVHLIIATQRPTRDIITGQIKVNLDSRVALRCPTAQDSRNIINARGAETLPRYGYGYYLTPETMQPQLIQVPYTAPEAAQLIIQHWSRQQPRTLIDRLKKHNEKGKNSMKITHKYLEELVEANRAALEAAIREGVELSLTAPQKKHMVTFDAATGSARARTIENHWHTIYFKPNEEIVVEFKKNPYDNGNHYRERVMNGWKLKEWEEAIAKYATPDDKAKYDEWRAEEIESYGEVEESDVVQWISDEADYIDSAIDEYCMDIAVKEANIDSIINKFLRNFPYDYDAEIEGM